MTRVGGAVGDELRVVWRVFGGSALILSHSNNGDCKISSVAQGQVYLAMNKLEEVSPHLLNHITPPEYCQLHPGNPSHQTTPCQLHPGKHPKI